MGPEMIGVFIPIVAITGAFATKAYTSYLEHQRVMYRRLDVPAPDTRAAQLENRVAQLEDRVTTLQDIVISGDYEVQRRLRQREIELHQASTHDMERPAAASPVTSQPYQTNREG